MTMEKEKLYECEVRRRRLHPPMNGYEWFWKVRSVQDAVEDGDTDYRCKDCHGAVKIHKRKLPHGPASHVEHKSRADSEYCVAGMYFRQAKDGRTPKLSSAPVL